MRFLPILAAATIGLFATAATAQNMNTSDPNSAPGASATGGKPKRANPAEIKKMDTSDPNSAPGVSATGGKPQKPSAAEIKRMDTTDPNSTPKASTTGQSSGAKKKKKNM
jgi:hypothetical protein